MSRLESHGGEAETQMFGGDATKRRRVLLAQSAEHIGRCKPFPFLINVRTTIMGVKHILQRRLAIICLVTTLHFLFFFLVQIITLAVQDFRFQLGIKLLVLNAFFLNHTGHFHAKETSASRRVTQDLSAIGGGDERGQARFGDIPQTLAAIHRHGHHLE